MEINSLYCYHTLSINLVGGAYEYAIIPLCCPPLIPCVESLGKTIWTILDPLANFASPLCSLIILIMGITNSYWIFLHERHCSKHFTFIASFSPCSNFLSWLILLSLYEEKEGAAERGERTPPGHPDSKICVLHYCAALPLAGSREGTRTESWVSDSKFL